MVERVLDTLSITADTDKDTGASAVITEKIDSVHWRIDVSKWYHLKLQVSPIDRAGIRRLS